MRINWFGGCDSFAELVSNISNPVTDLSTAKLGPTFSRKPLVTTTQTGGQKRGLKTFMSTMSFRIPARPNSRVTSRLFDFLSGNRGRHIQFESAVEIDVLPD